ncbi:hypothetical protein L1987_10174 [Smallanthus sonchifolius]|uniref:Uncharacterized protein n=1 Tax=Smallanthus sonchifolius TaxID=185202 RepID=A0ACB9JRC3_9ASTR|nr:hypothetical protein L1987_10174 [Smallanthus sonchifolius]
MVFHLRCLSISGVQETQSDDNFVTAPSRFDLRPSRSAPTSLNVDYVRSGVPSLNERSSNLRVFKLAELNEATKNFDQSTKLGEGGFGIVHLGTIKRLEPPFVETHVAVKRGKKGLKGQRQWQTEVDFLGEIEHQNLVKLIGYCYEEHGNESNWLLVKLIGYCYEEHGNA